MTLRYDTASGQWIDSDENQTTVQNPNPEQTATEGVNTAARGTETDAAAEQPATGSVWQNNTYSPIPEEPKKKKSKMPLLIGVIAAVAICLGIAIAIAMGGKKPSQEILQALQNTFKDETHTTKLWEQLGDLVKADYTISLNVSVNESDVSVKYSNDLTEPQFWMSYEDYWTDRIEFLAALTDSKVKVQLPYLSDYVYTYNYQEEKTGYLVESMDGAEDLDVLDIALGYIYDMNGMAGQEAYNEEFTAILMKEFMSWEFEEIAAKTFKVNEESIDCKGYKTTLDAEKMIALIEEVEVLYQEYGLDYWEDFPDYMENPFDTIYAGLEDMVDVEISFYLTKEQVACILMESEGDEIKISFRGNEHGAQDIEIEVDNYSLMEITHETDNTEEKTTIGYMGADLVTFSYDYEAHEFSLGIEYDYTDLLISGMLESNEEELKLSVDTFDFYGLIDNVGCEVTVKKGAEPQEMVGEEFDIGNATEEEFYEMLSEVYDNYMGDDSFPEYMMEDIPEGEDL